MNPALQQGKGLSELWQRIRFLLIALLVYRLGTHIPLPGIDSDQLQILFNQNQGTILGMFNMFSGGALERMSILALGVMPYITASIIMNLLTATVPFLEDLKKEGESGRRIIQNYTRYGTLFLSFFQAVAMCYTLVNQGIVTENSVNFYISAISSLVAGSMFMMWLGEQINERGIGNGISMLIFAGIVAGLPLAIGQTLESAKQGTLNTFLLIGIIILVFAVVYFVVFIERAQRRIAVSYAQRHQMRGQRQQANFLPLKINMAGVIPAIFASSLLLFPASIAQWFGQGVGGGSEILQEIALAIGPGQPLNLVLFSLLIVFFCFFYTGLVYNPRDVANNLKRGGGFVPGVRPGEQTAKYIDTVLTHLTTIGAIYITAVCLLPQILVVWWNIPFYLGGTSLLIAVVVTMDFMTQVQSHLMNHQYESIMKKANLVNKRR